MHPTGISSDVIENLNALADASRRVIAALAPAESNGLRTQRFQPVAQGRSNISLNASGISMDVIRKVGCLSQSFPPR
jgi:hypothetical protein